MGKGLKGFKDYRDYLSYAQVCLSWMGDKDHQKLYEMLLKRKGEIEQQGCGRPSRRVGPGVDAKAWLSHG